MAQHSKAIDQKRILMIVPTLAGGGAEQVVANLADSLSNQYNVDVLLDCNKVSYRCKSKIITLSNNEYEVSGLKKLLLYIKKLVWLREVKRKKKYDVYISHSCISNILNYFSGHNDNIILAMHGSVIRPKETSIIQKFIQKVEWYVFKNANKIVAVSQGVAEEMEGIIGVRRENLHVVKNGSDIVKIKKLCKKSIPNEQRELFNKSEIVITSMGRYILEKGQWHLIRALSEIVEKYPHIRLFLLGEGSLRTYYERLIRNLGLENNVFLIGFQENPFSIIANSDMFVFPSISEGYPCALVEAICCGVPCIATDFKSGAREVLEYPLDDMKIENEYKKLKYGILSPVCSGNLYEADDKLEKQEKILEEAILYFIEHPEEREKIIANNERRLQVFSIEQMAEEWKKVIEA